MTSRALLCFFYNGKIEIKKDDRISFLSISLGTIAIRRETFLSDFERRFFYLEPGVEMFGGVIGGCKCERV